MSAVEIFLSEAVFGLFVGWVIGALEAYNERLVYALMTAGAAIIAVAVIVGGSVTDLAGGVTPLWRFVVFFAFYCLGEWGGKKQYARVFGGGVA